MKMFCHCATCDRDFVRARRRGDASQCSPCKNNARVRRWRRSHPEMARRHKGYGGTKEQKARYAHSDRGRAMSRLKSARWARNNRERVAARRRELWPARYARDREAFKMAATNRRRFVKLATPPWVSLAAIAAIYADAHERGLEVDHIVPLRGKEVRGLHVPWNLRAVTREENRAKRNRLITLTEGNA